MAAPTLLLGNTMKADLPLFRALSTLSALLDPNNSKELAPHSLESRGRITKRKVLGKGLFKSMYEVLGTSLINPGIKPTRINTAKSLEIKPQFSLKHGRLNHSLE